METCRASKGGSPEGRPLAEELLFGKLAQGGGVHISVKDGKLDFELEARERTVALEPV